jgi:long-subunit fatty acid transport protein
MAKIYKDSVGIGIELDTKLPNATLISATDVKIAVKKPDGTSADWTAVIVPSTSRIRHTVQSGELASAGVYKLQAKLSFGAVTTRGDTVKITVYDNFL